MSDFQMIAVDDLVCRQDARPQSYDALMELEDSIRRVGLLNPLTVRSRPSGRFEILAGSHRFAACQAAGFQEIACQVVVLDNIRAELAMIDENLTRHDVKGILLDQQLARRKAIYIELNPQTANGATGAGRGKVRQNGEANLPARFTAETAAITGRSERTVQRSVERGEKIALEAASLIQGTPLDAGAYLHALKDVPAEEQVAKVLRDLAEPRRPAPPALPKPTPGEAYTRFLELAVEMGKLAPNDIVAGIPDARCRAGLMSHVRGLTDRLEQVDEIMGGGSHA